MLLATAIAGLERTELVGDDRVSITAVDYDSRQGPGWKPVLLRRGRRCTTATTSRPTRCGGVLVPCSSNGACRSTSLQVVVPDVRAAMARVASTFHDDPSATLTVIGVTGTNGKTTTVQLIANAFAAAGRRCRGDRNAHQ